jgi:hypothetical protein
VRPCCIQFTFVRNHIFLPSIFFFFMQAVRPSQIILANIQLSHLLTCMLRYLILENSSAKYVTWTSACTNSCVLVTNNDIISRNNNLKFNSQKILTL